MQALSDFADYVQKQQALRRPPGQKTTVLEDHDELDIIDQLGLADDTPSRIALRTLLLTENEENDPALVEHLRGRLVEGHGETLFDLGLEDNGDSMGFSKEEWNTALERLGNALKELHADYKILMTRNIGGDVEVGPVNAKEKGACGKLILRRTPQSVDDVIETRIAVVGNGMLNVLSMVSVRFLTWSSRRRQKHHAWCLGKRRTR